MNMQEAVDIVQRRMSELVPLAKWKAVGGPDDVINVTSVIRVDGREFTYRRDIQLAEIKIFGDDSCISVSRAFLRALMRKLGENLL